MIKNGQSVKLPTENHLEPYYEDNDSEKIKSADINKPGFGVLVGAECVFGKISVGARYAVGMTNVPDSPTDDFRHKIFQVLVGYNLP